MSARRLVAPAACALVLFLAGCGSDSGSPTTTPTVAPTPTPAVTPTPPIPAGGAGFTYDGITHVSWSRDEYGLASGTTSRQALAATRANWGGLLVTWYMETRTSNTIAPDASSSPADDGVLRAIDELHALGLKVMLKPHLDVRDGTWRAQIAPTDPAAWWASYVAFMDHYTEIAARKNVGMLCIGTELASMSGSRYSGEWAGLVGRIRGRYRGLLTYAANGVDAADEFTSVSFWGRIDLMGVDVYTPLTAKNDPTRAELVAAWRRNKNGSDMVAAFKNAAQAHGKDLIFTEIGYRSGNGANSAPWDYSVSTSSDPGEQADCYAAMYEVWSAQKSWMKGPFWWSWDVSVPGPGDTGYNPRGKPAEDQLRGWQ
jgi:hypothetical protein